MLKRYGQRRIMTGALLVLSFVTTVALLTSLAVLSTQGSYAGANGDVTGSGALISACLNAGSSTCSSSETTQTALYSHSWYIDDPTEMATLGAGDAKWLNQESPLNHCKGDFLTVLDFSHPTMLTNKNASPLDNYAMSIFSKPQDWQTFRQVEKLAEVYIENWVANATACPHLRLALGTNNYTECMDAVVSGCDLTEAGKAWDMVGHDVAQWVQDQGYQYQITAVWLADDLEGSWDPWPTTLKFLEGVRVQEHTYSKHINLVDFGDANAGACSEVTGRCDQGWTEQNVLQAAWQVGWDLPLPETYSHGQTGRWISLAHDLGQIHFTGIMTECSGPDPLPRGLCWVRFGKGTGECQWGPTMGVQGLQPADPSHQITYATNIQWLEIPKESHAC